MPPVLIIGRFPPPFDGQALATARLADLLSDDASVVRVNLQPPEKVIRYRSSLAPARIRHFLSARSQVRRALSGHPESVVIWPSISPSLLGHLRDRVVVANALQAGQRVVAVVHRGNFDHLFRQPLIRSSARRLIEELSGFVFLTHELSRRCAEWIPDRKRFVVPNTIDQELVVDEASIARKHKERSARSAVKLLFVANMIPSKGYVDVLDAIWILRRRGMDVSAHFAGGWLNEQGAREFEKRLVELGIGDCVVHHGAIESRDELRRLYEECDVFLLPTYYENEAQPLSILEAMNAGLPIITTRHAGIPEMAESGREAIFVAPHVPSEIAAAIELLFDYSTWESMSSAVRARFVRDFEPGKVRELWLALLDKVAVAAPLNVD